MSLRTRNWFSQWKVFRDWLGTCTFRFRSQEISECDRQIWADALQLWLILTEDLGLLGPLQGRVLTRAKALCRIDISVLLTFLKEADSYLLSRLEDKVPNDLGGFIRHLETFGDPRVILWPLRLVLKKYFSSGDVHEFRTIHQWTTFLSRVQLSTLEDEEFVAAYVESDNAIRSPDLDLAEECNVVIRRWLKDFRFSGCPRHGSGAVADPPVDGLNLSKYERLGSDILIQHALRQSGFDQRLFPVYSRIWSRTNLLRCVPKSALKKRTICMEPVTLMYWQQAILYDLFRLFKDNAEIAQHIDLAHAEKNAQAAQQASFFGVDSTIDLSAASDSVSWELVRKCFAGTRLLPWLYATRSRYVQLPDGSFHRLRKFASMGNATTFPIECLIFAAICEVTLSNAGMHAAFYRVYGDDIVIPTRVVSSLITNLENLGFTVNRDKSFYLKAVNVFRESCGGEYLGGYDVTPMRLSRRFKGLNVEASSVAVWESMVELANASFDKGFHGLRRWVLHCFSKLPMRLQPIRDDGTNGIKTLGPADNSMRERSIQPFKTEDFCTVYIRGGRVKRAFDTRRKPINPLTELFRYEEWVDRSRRRKDVDDLIDMWKISFTDSSEVDRYPYGPGRLVSAWVRKGGF